MIRVAIVTPSSELARKIAELVAWEDQIEVVSAGARFDRSSNADVLIVAGVPVQDVDRSRTPVLLLVAGIPDELPITQTIRACLAIDSQADELRAAVLALSNDLTVMTQEQANAWVLRGGPSALEQEAGQSVSEALTKREIEVLRMIAAGLSNKEIAVELGVSSHTAKFHVAQIMAKLGAMSRTEAASLGIRRGLVPL